MLNANDYLNTVFDDRYKIIREIGRGASSIVFVAEDTLKNCQVAIKLLDSDADEYKVNSKSFQNEIEALTEMDYHANIVGIYDASFEGKIHYIAMEYVQGCTLRRYMDTHKVLPEEVIIDFSSQVLDALRAAHSNGIIHRDIKPQNILLTQAEDGNEVQLVKLADFGIARLPENDRFMMKDRGIGTVHYISPEQASGAPVTARSDIYSLGVLMYEMATGKAPFHADCATAIITQHQTDLPEDPRSYNPNLSVGMKQIILKALEKDPARRFKSADEMLRALTRLQHGEATVLEVKEKEPKPPKTYKEAKDKKKKQEREAKWQREGGSFLGGFDRRWLIGIASALLAVAVIVGTVLLITLPDRNPTHEVQNYIGQTLESVQARPDVTVTRVVYQYNSAAFGKIIDQSPKQGTLEPGEDDSVVLYVSCGAQNGAIGKLTAGDCANTAAAEAALKKENPLLAAAFRSEAAEEHNPLYAVGAVVAMDFLDKDGNTLTTFPVELPSLNGRVGINKDLIKTVVLYTNPAAVQ